MRFDVEALRLTIYISKTDHWHHRPLYAEIVHRAHVAGLDGVSVLRGVCGYGESWRSRPARMLPLGDEVPVVIIMVDTEDEIRAFLPQLAELVPGRLVTMEKVEALRYFDWPAGRARPRGRRGGAPLA